MKNQNDYTDEFREQIVKLANNGRPVVQRSRKNTAYRGRRFTHGSKNTKKPDHSGTKTTAAPPKMK